MLDRPFPRIVLLYCQHVAANQPDAASRFESAGGFTVRPILMPCSAKVEVPHILRVLEQGADGVEVVTCPEGKCRSLVGNVMAEKRIAHARRLLDQAGLGAERIGLSRGEGFSVEDLSRLARERAAAAMSRGPNPMKAAAAGAPKGGQP